MGIPRFYRLIKEQFPNISNNISFNEGFNLLDNETIIDNLYLDANGILHNCSREIYFPTTNKPKLAKKDAKKDVKLVYKAICNYFDQLLQFVQPTKLFYIAIDGTAPVAKQIQQRQRRYKASLEKSDEEINKFDSTCITPGTDFMNNLSIYINKYIKKRGKENNIWKKVKIIFSDPNEPGEGEHKIVNYIHNCENKDELTHCMYGLDADLFMLGLATHCPKFYLLREDVFHTKWKDVLFHKVDIGLLRKEMFNYWGGIGGNEKCLINDFIFTCFLIGNDFLHALPCCHDLQTSILYLMQLRKKILGNEYITKNSSFNLTNLLKLLKNLSLTEEAEISKQFFRQNFPNATLNSSMKDIHKPKLGVDLKKYKKLYYKKAGIDYSDKIMVHNFCKNYLQGLEWVQYYYHNKPNNWHWFFPYHYTPLVNDIVDYLENSSKGTKLTRVSNKLLNPINPIQQLLCVVPPRSKDLIPSHLQEFYKKIVEKYYPESCKIDLEGKIKDWEGIALLPFIDLSEILSF